MNQELLRDAYYHYILSAIQSGKKQEAITRYVEMAAHFQDDPVCKALFSLVYPMHIKAGLQKTYILGIGIDEYQKPFNKLKGCVNDAQLFIDTMRETLVNNNERIEAKTIFLANEKATRQNIHRAFDILVEYPEINDTVVIYFSGFAGTGVKSLIIAEAADNKYVFATYDTKAVEKNQKQQYVTGEEVHEYMQKIKAMNKFLVIDSNTNSDYFNLIEESGDYTVMFGCDDGEMSYEREFDGKTHGVFTYALTSLVSEFRQQGIVPQNLYQLIVKYIKDKNFNQTPKMSGDITPLFFPQKDLQPAELAHIALNYFEPLSDENYYKITNLIQKFKTYKDLAPEMPDFPLNKKKISEFLGTPFFPALKKIGLYLFNKGDIGKASNFFEKYYQVAGNDNDDPENLIALVELLDRLGQYSKAEDLLKKFISANPSLDNKHPVFLLLKKYQSFSSKPESKYALLIGINNYKKLKDLKSAKQDAEAWMTYLSKDLQIPASNITLLLNKDASRKNILAQYEKHAALAATNPVLFFFAGYGSAYPLPATAAASTRALLNTVDQTISDNNTPIMPALVPADSRHNDIPDITFKELTDIQIRSESRFLTCILDTGFEEHIGGRGTEPAESLSKSPGFDGNSTGYTMRPLDSLAMGIGNAALLPGIFNPQNLSEKQKLYCIETPEGGIFTNNLLTILRNGPKGQLRLAQIAREFRKKRIDVLGGKFLQVPLIIGDPEFLLLHFFRVGKAEIEQVKSLPVQSLKSMLEQTIGSNWGDFPDNQVILALAESMLGNTEKALSMLTVALTDGEKEKTRHVKANYHLGRLLVETTNEGDRENWSQALNALRIATETLTGFAPAYYYLGKAINQISIIEGRSEALKAFSIYKENSYPIGHKEEVDDYLDSLDENRRRSRFMSDGIKHLERNELGAAERCFQEARLLGENTAFYYMAEIYNKQNDFLRALNSYNQAKILKVDRDDIPYKIADMLMLMLTTPEFVNMVSDELKAYDENPSILKYEDTSTLKDALGLLIELLDSFNPKPETR